MRERDKEGDIRKYYFSTKVAIDVGIEEAIMFSNIYFWVIKNSRDGDDDHFHKGKWWMYNPVVDFVKQYPFWTVSMVKRILKNLKDAEYIDTGVFNRFGYDKTKWYTITNKGFNIIEVNNGLVRKGEWLGEN